jgi:hypothetical protein
MDNLTHETATGKISDGAAIHVAEILRGRPDGADIMERLNARTSSIRMTLDTASGVLAFGIVNAGQEQAEVLAVIPLGDGSDADADGLESAMRDGFRTTH